MINYSNSGERSRLTTRTIRVFVKNCEQITTILEEMQREFFLKAAEINIAIRARGRRRNVPGYPHAIDCLLSGIEPGQYIDRLISECYRARIKQLEKKMK
ncbi:hypothetical protein METP3_01251 [Methanosarcinales archaeon]|nr:MAG: hypothetical protein OI861_00050 [Candidatus Methanoperedens sp.]CAG0967835.1 hypothetical protein METP3_01251 [Methanosarcinales archaeon]